MSTPVTQTAAAEPLEAGGQAERSPFLSGPPRSGELSPFAQKLAAQCFIWLASIVVFGSTADFAAKRNQCGGLCRFGIATGVISFFITSAILVGHYLTWSSKVDKGSWFSSAAEKRYMFMLAIWWTAGVSCLSAFEKSQESLSIPVPHTSNMAIMFGWLAFFGSIYGAYKAYHSQKEEQKSFVYAQILSMQQTEEEEYANFS